MIRNIKETDYQNLMDIWESAVFYRHMGFSVASRSELDAVGKAYPILYMRRQGTESTENLNLPDK